MTSASLILLGEQVNFKEAFNAANLHVRHGTRHRDCTQREPWREIMQRPIRAGIASATDLLAPQARYVGETLAGMDGDGELDESLVCVVVATDGLQRGRPGINS